MKAFAVLLLTLTGSAFGQAINPNVTQANIHQTICVKGWTGTIRPPQSVTGAIKAKMMKQQHLTGSGYILDHIIPLETGGAPLDSKNLQLQTTAVAHVKDLRENAHNSAVCSGKETLQQAQDYFRQNRTLFPRIKGERHDGT